MEFMFLGIKLYDVFLYYVSMMSVKLSILLLEIICYKVLVNKYFNKSCLKKDLFCMLNKFNGSKSRIITIELNINTRC